MSKRKGTRAERRAIRILEAAGYTCSRAGGSLGIFDVVALGPADVRAIQVKAGTARLSAVEREAIRGLVLAPNANPIAGIGAQIPPALISRFLHSRAGVQLLSKGFRIPAGNKLAGAAWGAELSRFVQQSPRAGRAAVVAVADNREIGR